MNEINREKVIKGMEQFRADLKPFCGNHADWERFDAGFSLLKEQEAINYTDCSDAMLKMWMENVLTDGEYRRIMDKLNKAHEAGKM